MFLSSGTEDSRPVYHAGSYSVSIVIDGDVKIGSRHEAFNADGLRFGGQLTYVADLRQGDGTAEIYIEHPGGWQSSDYTSPDGRSNILIEEF